MSVTDLRSGVGWLLTFMVLLLLSTTSRADWNPGSAPFIGTPEEGCRLLEGSAPLSYQECMTGVLCIQKGGGYVTYLQDGEPAVTTTTHGGESSAKSTTVGVKDEAGQTAPANHWKRRAVACPLGRVDGLVLALPDACRNWTVIWRTPQQSTRRSVVRVSPPNWVESPRRFIPGLLLPGCCDCYGSDGPRLYLPGVYINPNSASPVNSGPTFYRTQP